MKLLSLFRDVKVVVFENGEILKKIYNIVPDNSVLIYDLYFNFDIIEGECE